MKQTSLLHLKNSSIVFLASKHCTVVCKGLTVDRLAFVAWQCHVAEKGDLRSTATVQHTDHHGDNQQASHYTRYDGSQFNRVH